MEEQIAIATYLDVKCTEIDALITDVQEQIDVLEQYKCSSITEAVTRGIREDFEVDESRVFYVYLNLWSDIDPTETANRIRGMMYAAGFSMIEESDKGYNQPAYDSATRQYTVQWTWCLREDVD